MNVFDKFVSAINPKAGLKRAVARKQMDILNYGYGNHGASTKKNSMSGWVTANASALEDIEDNIETLRERSRDLFMGAPIATGALKSMVTNIVGAGLKLNAQIDYEYLGMTLEEADDWETNVEREFALWAESPNCDTQRMNNFYELQQLVFLSQLMSGDCFVITPMISRAGTPYEMTLQVIEADRVCNPNNFNFDNRIINGVEIDKKGEIIAYHIADHHPNSRYGIGNKWTRIEKYGKDSGRPNILHLMEMERPEQRRGVPILAPVVESLKQLSRYSEAELMATVVSSMFTAFIETEAPPESDFGGITDYEQLDTTDDDVDVELGNGLVNYLREGEKVSFANPSRPNTSFDGFVTSICRQIGVALEVPYEVLMKHFTSSYSASRGALLEAWKMYKKRRDWLAMDFCQPIYELFLMEAIAKGRVYAPGFFNDSIVRKAYFGAEWNGPTQGQLDPEKEVRAAELRVTGGYSTRTREAIELTGGDFFQYNRLRSLEEKVRKEAGLSDSANIAEPQEEPREEVGKGED
jgi:lambda family phage portal protein